LFRAVFLAKDHLIHITVAFKNNTAIHLLQGFSNPTTFGSLGGSSCGEDHAMPQMTWNSIPAFYPLDTSDTIPSCDNRKYSDGLLTAHWGEKSELVENH
jgi:hypothetical protein